MRSTRVTIGMMSALAGLALIAFVAILVLPTGLLGSDLAAKAQVGAAIFSAFALILSILAIIITAQVSSSGFRAEEDVKVQTAQLVAGLRTIFLKSVSTSQFSPDAPVKMTFEAERTLLNGFLNSTTGVAYWKWQEHKSALAKGKPENWRIFFLRLVAIIGCEDADFRLMKKHASELLTMLRKLRTSDYRKIASYVSDLEQAVQEFQTTRDNDVYMNLLFGEVSNTSEHDGETLRRKLLYLKQMGIQDPDIDLFLGVLGNDVTLVKATLDAGANPSVTDSQLLARYAEALRGFHDTP